MAANREAPWIEHHEFLVILGRLQFAFDSFEDAIEALEWSGIIRDDGNAAVVLDRRTVSLRGESVEMRP